MESARISKGILQFRKGRNGVTLGSAGDPLLIRGDNFAPLFFDPDLLAWSLARLFWLQVRDGNINGGNREKRFR
jgi:hypothetical protein